MERLQQVAQILSQHGQRKLASEVACVSVALKQAAGRNRAAFANPYAQQIGDVRQLREYLAEDIRITEQLEDLRLSAIQKTQMMIGEVLAMLRRNPLAVPTVQNEVLRSLTDDMRMAVREVTGPNWPEPQRSRKTLLSIKDLLGRQVRPNFPVMKAVLRSLNESLPELMQIHEQHRKMERTLGDHFDDIERLFKEVILPNPHTDEEFDVNHHLNEIKKLYEKGDASMRKLDPLFSAVIDTLLLGNPAQISMF